VGGEGWAACSRTTERVKLIIETSALLPGGGTESCHGKKNEGQYVSTISVRNKMTKVEYSNRGGFGHWQHAVQEAMDFVGKRIPSEIVAKKKKQRRNGTKNGEKIAIKKKKNKSPQGDHRWA